MGGLLLNFCRTNYCNMLTLIFGSFWWHLEISRIWKLEIWKSGSSLEMAVLVQFQYIGYFPHSVLVTELDFQHRFSKFQSAWNFSRIFLKSGNSLEFAVLGPFQSMWHHFHLILASEIDFLLRISNFPFFLEHFQNFSDNLEILWNLPVLADFNILGIIFTPF